MRTPFTKRINIYGYNYLTDSPGPHIQEAAQPFDINTDPNTITNEEWQAMRSERQPTPTGDQSGRERLRRSLTHVAPSPPAQADDDPFEDIVKPIQEESDISGSDEDYQPPVRKVQQPSFLEDLIVMAPQTPPPLTAIQKGKGKAITRDDQPAVAAKGRLRNSTVDSFRALGASTRKEAQRLADLHSVNLATVMRHAGLGAGAGSRITSDCNSFKAVHAARILAETGGMSLCY